MQHHLRNLLAIGLTVTVGVFVAPSTAASRHVPKPPVLEAPSGCERLDLTELDIEVAGDGEVNFTYPADGYDTCDEAMQVRSFSSGPAGVDDHHDRILSTVVPSVGDIEAAGPGGLTVELTTDPCYTGVEIHLDGDTLLYSNVFGSGCDMTIRTHASSPWQEAELHVVQQTGPIQPPHIWSTVGDDETVLTGLPNGTWYAKVFDGWTPGSTIDVDGGGPVAASTVHDVDDGSEVDIDLAPTPRRPIDRFTLTP